MLATGDVYLPAPATTLAELRALAARLDQERAASSGSPQVAGTARSLAIQTVRILYNRNVTEETEAYALELPFSVAWTLARALSGDPRRGFASYTELVDLLAPGPRSLSLRPAEASVQVPSQVRRPARAAVVALGLVLLLLAGAVWLAQRAPGPGLSSAALLVVQGAQVEARAGARERPFELCDFGEPVAAVACDREILYASLPASGRVERLRLATGQLLSPLPVGQGAGCISVQPAGEWLAVAYPRARLLKLWRLGNRPGPAAAVGLEGNPRAVAVVRGVVYIRFETGRVEARAVPSLQALAASGAEVRFPDPGQTWWPGP